tara:strand:- start:21407 stop:22606 length:1200 start_codon:yes stop_codon:yes gene_type:complete
MSITVTKSKNVTLQESEESALQSVLQTLQKQSAEVKSVTVLPNFSIDTDTALQMNVPLVTQGLVVCVSRNYTLSRDDMSWFHPSVGRGRSVYAIDAPTNKTKLQSVTFSTQGSSVGEFVTSHPDEFGCEDVVHHIVVDTAPDLSALYAKWLDSSLTAGEVQQEWKRTQFKQAKSVSAYSQSHRDSLVRGFAHSSMYTDTINDVLSDISHVYFTNNCVKQHSTRVLVKSSALGGYRMYTTTNTEHQFYPASLGTVSGFYSWSDMTPKNMARIESSCSWDDKLSFNTQVMRPPALRAATVRKVEDEYGLTSKENLVMRLSHFSGSAAFVDKMSPNHVFQLSPESNSDYITAPIDPTHPVFSKVVRNIVRIQQQFPNFQLLNPKFVRGDRLKLPREVYKQVV